MDERRQNRTSRLIQKELSIIFQRNSTDYLSTMISVTSVKVTPDLSLAKIYLSVFPSAKSKDVFGTVLKISKTIRYNLAQKIKNQLRKTPELVFYIDDSLDYAEKIDELLKN